MSDHPLPGTSVVVDGVRLHVVLHGSGTGLPVLLLHDADATSDGWTDVVHGLAARPGPGRRCLAPDLAGLGRSETPVGRRLDLPAQATMLRRLLEVEGLERAFVVGHGLGGSVAVHLAALAPERVAGLVLVAAPLHADAEPSSALPGRLVRRAAEALPGRRRLQVDLAGVEGAWRVVRSAPPPLLLLWGTADEALPAAYGRRVAGEVPQAAWVPVADAGHLLPTERPERVAEEVAAFASEVESGSEGTGAESGALVG